MDILISLSLMLMSAVLIVKACDGFEAAADYLGRNMSKGVKGASINAIGSSMPELFATFMFLFFFYDTSGFSGGIGTTAGSAVYNSMIIPAVSILVALKMFKISSINVSKDVILRDGLMLIAAEFVLIVTIRETLEWWHGMMLMLLYVGYFGYMFLSIKKDLENQGNKEEVDEDNNEENQSNRVIYFLKFDLEDAIIGGNKMTIRNSWALLSVATIIIALASYILVNACESLALNIGVQGYFVAVILVAAVSSIPDTILSMKDSKKGNHDDALSNALGSNIFDICFVLGLPLFLYTVIYGPIHMPTGMVENVVELRILLLFFTISVFFIFFFGRSLGKKKAYALLAMYAAFTVFIVAKAYEMPWIQPVSEVINSIGKYLQ